MKRGRTKCTRCRDAGAVVELRRHNAAFCRIVYVARRKGVGGPASEEHPV